MMNSVTINMELREGPQRTDLLSSSTTSCHSPHSVHLTSKTLEDLVGMLRVKQLHVLREAVEMANNCIM